MANEIGNGNKFNASFLNVNYTGPQYENDMMDLLKQVDSDPVWINGFGKTGELSETGELSSTSSTSSVDGSFGSHRGVIDTLAAVSNLLDQVNKLAFSASEPDACDCCHPEGSLNVGSDGVVTTPGGFKIEATKQHTWKITGPDGKSTEIWGDPHVKEGDGGKWDFKRDSTFVLADGTKINVSTTPWKDGKMTVTKGLEIISGNDRVQVTDIDKGKGKVGDVTKDGYAHANSFGNKDVFVMGNEADDWSFKGKEIVGSNDGGNSFKLGKDLPAGEVGPLVDQAKKNGGDEFFNQMYKQISAMFDALMSGMGTGKVPDLGKLEFPNTVPENGGCFPPPGQQQQQTGLDRLSKSFAAVAAMFNALAKILDLANSIPSRRTYQPV